MASRFRMPSPLAATLTLAMAAASAARVEALEIRILPPPGTAFGCDVTLSGPIEPGDAVKAESALEPLTGRDNRTACLNSMGGAYNEGLLLAGLFRRLAFSTRLVPGARCLSSCAVAFMGGAWNSGSGEGILAHRLMSPSAKLGFHAPYLKVGGSDYNEANVRSAYKQATTSMGRLLDVSLHIDFDLKLVQEMLFQGEEEFFYIDTIEKLGRYGVGLHGYAPIDDAAWRKFHSCWNIYSWRRARMTFDSYSVFHRDEDAAAIRIAIADDAKAYQDDPGSFQEGGADFLLVPGDFTIRCSIHFGSEEVSFLGVPVQEDHYQELSGPEEGRPAEGVVPAWSRLDGATPLSQLEQGVLTDLPFALGHRPQRLPPVE